MMKMFITLEGIEGVGKTTQIKLLENALKNNKIDFISTREPGGAKSAEAIRELLLNTEMSSKTELLLYEAARAEHLEKIIKPALTSNKVVICDRYTDATIAYQGYGRGIDLDLINKLNDIATDNIYPDITIILDITVEQSNDRLIARGSTPDRFEKLGNDFYVKVRQGYLDIQKKEPKRVYIIDATQAIDEIHKQIFEIIIKGLGI